MVNARGIAGLCVLATLAGCAQASGTSGLTTAALTPAEAKTALLAPGRALALPRPAELGRGVEAQQMLTAKHQDQTYTFEGRISVTGERLVLVGLDGMGRRAMTVSWNGHEMSVETASWLPATVRPGSMLADIVVLFWPESAVKPMLTAAGCELKATPKSRRVRCGDTEVLKARYDWAPGAKWNGTLQYSNLAWGYEIEVQSQEIGR